MRFIPTAVADNLRAVVEAISINPDSFNMQAWYRHTNCGTVLCLAGHYNVARGFMPMASGFDFWDGQRIIQALQLFIEDCGLEWPMPKAYGDDDRRFWLFNLWAWPGELQYQLIEDRLGAVRAAVGRYLAEFEIEANAESSTESSVAYAESTR